MRASTRILLPALALLTMSACKQPDMDCTSAHGTFAARFDLEKGSKDDPCGALEVDIIGMQTYFAEGGVNGTPKFAESTIAMRTQYLYAYVYDRYLHDRDADLTPDVADNCVEVFNPDQADADMDMVGDACGSNTPVEPRPAIEDVEALDKAFGDPDAVSKFTVGVDGEGFCAAPDFNTVELSLPEVPLIAAGAIAPAVPDDPATPDVDETTPADPEEDIPGQPAAELKYVWDGVRFLVTADAQGTQFEGTLKFTQDGSTCEYRVRGVYPAFGCAEAEDCHAEGSPLNPDFKLDCVGGLCVLDADLPAYE